MLEATIADSLRDRWLRMELSDTERRCPVKVEHIYCVARPEAIRHHPVNPGALFEYESAIYSVCSVDRMMMDDGPWLMIYAHSKEEDRVVSITEEEWHELYGCPDLASGS